MSSQVPRAGEKVWEFGRARFPAESVCGKALKRGQNPDRLAGTDGELIRGKEAIDSPQGWGVFPSFIHPKSLEVYYVRSS